LARLAFPAHGQEPTASTETNALTLDVLVAAALAQNPELKFYQAELLAARGGRQAAGWTNPEIAGGIGQKTVRGDVQRAHPAIEELGRVRVASGRCLDG
jgi:outer membrane protein TolC